MKFQLMRYHFEQHERIMLDLFNFKTNQNIEVCISMKYWHADKKSVQIASEILHLLCIKGVEHSIDEWFSIVREYLCFVN